MDRAFPCEGRGRWFESSREDRERKQLAYRAVITVRSVTRRAGSSHKDSIEAHDSYKLLVLRSQRHCVAQLVERHPDTVKAAGSNPAAVTPEALQAATGIGSIYVDHQSRNRESPMFAWSLTRRAIGLLV